VVQHVTLWRKKESNLRQVSGAWTAPSIVCVRITALGGGHLFEITRRASSPWIRLHVNTLPVVTRFPCKEIPTVVFSPRRSRGP
jgi:hypothetical protein